MNETVTIRPLEERDIKRCLEIYNYYIENTTVTFEEVPLSYEDFHKRLTCIAADYPFLVAEDGGTVIGYAYLDKYNPRSAYRYTADLSVYFDKSAVLRGCGSRIYAALEKEAVKREFKNIVSLITADNAASIAFHKKQGFNAAGMLCNVGLKFGKTLSVAIYQKEIG